VAQAGVELESLGVACYGFLIKMFYKTRGGRGVGNITDLETVLINQPSI
jgi:hypothetical protein